MNSSDRHGASALRGENRLHRTGKAGRARLDFVRQLPELVLHENQGVAAISRCYKENGIVIERLPGGDNYPTFFSAF